MDNQRLTQTRLEACYRYHSRYPVAGYKLTQDLVAVEGRYQKGELVTKSMSYD